MLPYIIKELLKKTVAISSKDCIIKNIVIHFENLHCNRGLSVNNFSKKKI